jgi:hypothetical protein
VPAVVVADCVPLPDALRVGVMERTVVFLIVTTEWPLSNMEGVEVISVAPPSVVDAECISIEL